MKRNPIVSKYLLLLFAYLTAPTPSSAETPLAPGLKVPPGFEVTEFADSALANDIYCMTVDPKGRVIVSGRGYIRILIDENGGGRATKSLDFKDAPKDGAMGLFWESDTLYCMGDGGLRRYTNATGSGRDRPSELIAKLKTGGEHESHAIRRGPDGWLYVLCGNSSLITSANATLPTSPIKNPIAGCVLRFSPDFKGCEIVADGLRNAYGFDFNAAGQLFTFDSDNERCVSLPWYEPTRLYHVVDGAHFGWQNPQHAVTWRYPPYFIDVNAPIATLGRGSPTGVACYNHVQFPSKYHDGLFLLDWTFGRIDFVALKKQGASYATTTETFLQATGDNGFAPTAAAVDPTTGDLFVSIGGRGTRGAVYRIRYPKNLETAKAAKLPAPTPRGSLTWSDDLAKSLPEKAASEGLSERREALDQLRRYRTHFADAGLARAVKANWSSEDRTLFKAAVRLFGDLDEKTQQSLADEARTPRERLCVYLARPGKDRDAALLWLGPTIADKAQPVAIRLDSARLIQREIGDLLAPKMKGTAFEGYSRRQVNGPIPESLIKAVLAAFPAGESDLDRELSRILAQAECADAEALRKATDRLSDKSDPLDDFHYLIVLARLTAKRSEEQTKRIAAALLDLDRKIVALKRNRDSNWTPRLLEVYQELSRLDSALNLALLANPEFGRPDHVLFTKAPGFDRRKAAEIFLKRSQGEPDFAWNASLIALLGELPEEKTLDLVRKLWGEHGLDGALLPLLARKPREEDRPRFLEGLASSQPGTVRLSLDVLEKLPPRNDKQDILQIILALRRVPSGKESDPLRDRLSAFLRKVTGETHVRADDWTTWYVKLYPDQAKKLGDLDGVDVEAWSKRFAAVKWDAGNAERGRVVYQKASCASCHSGTQALGPDLRGVANRFARADLFTAIVQPSKDVSPRYRTTLIGTADGKVYQGLIIYEAVDSLILQTGPATTLRLTNKQITERRPTATSLMPAGLIDKFNDTEIADLYAYLKSQ